jgi:hypothetical protein
VRRRVRVDAVYGCDRQSSNHYIGHKIYLLLPVTSRGGVSAPTVTRTTCTAACNEPTMWAAPAAVII